MRALAKINLDLRVLNRRPDGFHELRTLFQTISLADVIDIEYTPQGRSQLDLACDLQIPDNLMLRAANLYLEAAKVRGRLALRLDKRIPMGGGLGGGSSDAATVLLALPVLTGRAFPIEKLMELGAQLGSDVPFFLLGGAALGLGRGTELYPALELGPKPALVVTPGVHVSTAEAYRALKRELTAAPDSRIIMSFQSLAWGLGTQAEDDDWQVVNDFETVVFRQHPQLKSIKGELRKLGANPALMSGSGSTLFGIFKTVAAREQAALRLAGELGAERVHRVTLVSRNRYRALWWRQLRPHVEEGVWPPRSRYLR